MFRKLFLVVFVLSLLADIAVAQSYSVWFTSPTDGGTANGAVVSGSQSSIHLTFSWSGQKADPQNIWVFYVFRDVITGLSKTASGQAATSTWTDEYSPYCDLDSYVADYNYYWIMMYEETQGGIRTKRAEQRIGVNVQQTVYVVNNFGTGTVTVNSNSNFNSGEAAYLSENSSLSLEPVQYQTDNEGYQRVWTSTGQTPSEWTINQQWYSSSYSTSYYANQNQNGAEISCVQQKLFNTVYSNDFGGGVLTVGSSAIASGSIVPTASGNSVTASASWQVYNGIEYTFSRWHDYTTTNPKSFLINSNNNITAYYTGRPVGVTVSFSTTVGQPVVINWTDNPNSNVTQYRVHRRIFQNGVWSADAVIATVNSGVESYTDYDFNLGVWQQDILLEYGVTSYYSTDNAWSQGGANTRVYCTIGASMQNNDLALAKTESEVPAEFAISNYPNPFNPTTAINYQLPNDGMVTIKVYDIIGKEVTTLVNEQKSAGYYKVDFDASKLTSGVYICTIQASNFSKSIKLLLTK